MENQPKRTDLSSSETLDNENDETTSNPAEDAAIPKKRENGRRSEHQIETTPNSKITEDNHEITNKPREMPEASNAPQQSENNSLSGESNPEPQPSSSNAVLETQNQDPEQQNLREDSRHAGRRPRSRRRGRRRGRRRRRGRQRARARARAREEAQLAMADISDEARSSSDSEDENRDASIRSRSPRGHRSLDYEELLRSTSRPASSRTQHVPCRVPNCDWSGLLEDAAQHARTDHVDAILRGPRHRLSVPLAFAAYTRYWRLVDAFDELFLVQFRRRAGSRRRLQAAVQLVGPVANAARFLYLLHMQVVESHEQTDPVTAVPQSTSNCSTPPIPSTTRISLVLGQTSSTRVDLEPAMISLWSAYNFSHTETSLENVSSCLSAEQSICDNTSAPRILDLTLTIQRVLGHERHSQLTS